MLELNPTERTILVKGKEYFKSARDMNVYGLNFRHPQDWLGIQGNVACLSEDPIKNFVFSH